jgi:hypothetical protein
MPEQNRANIVETIGHRLQRVWPTGRVGRSVVDRLDRSYKSLAQPAHLRSPNTFVITAEPASLRKVFCGVQIRLEPFKLKAGHRRGDDFVVLSELRLSSREFPNGGCEASKFVSKCRTII